MVTEEQLTDIGFIFDTDETTGHETWLFLNSGVHDNFNFLVSYDIDSNICRANLGHSSIFARVCDNVDDINTFLEAAYFFNGTEIV